MHQDSTVMPSEARDQGAFEARVAKLVADIDALVTITVKALNKSKLQTVRTLGVAVGQHAFTLRLSISMERPAPELLDTAANLEESLGELRLLSSRTRIDQATRVALALLEQMAEQLCGDLAVAASA
jgi:hypothetical protein